MKVVSLLNSVLQKCGAELKRYPDSGLSRRIKLLKQAQINLVFDVGANKGQYAIEIRKLGFKGKIISFEPLKDAFRELERKAIRTKDWQAVNMGIGDFDGETIINVAANSFSSSVLEMLPAHLESAPDSEFIKKENIKIKRIDSVINDYSKPFDHIFLKIDTQGFEKKIMDGALNSLEKIHAVQMEMSLVALYRGETLFWDMVRYMESKGFSLFSLEPGFSDQNTGRLLQVDGIFLKSL